MDNQRIIFGTDGWRGIISREVTFSSMTRVGRAVSRVLGPGSRVMVGYDNRFLGAHYGRLLAGVMILEGLDVLLSSQSCPTPALSHAVPAYGARAGLMVTASHNPPTYSGVKIKDHHGGPASPEIVTDVAQAALDADPCLPGTFPHVPVFDHRPAYLSRLVDLVDRSSLARLEGQSVVVDSFHGPSATYMPPLLRGLGLKVVEVRGEPNPGFGGVSPEPGKKTAQLLGEAVRQTGAVMGIMFDGDGDRLAAWAEPSGFIHPQHVFLLLLDHLARGRGWRGSVVRTTAVTTMVDRLAGVLGYSVIGKPVGFGHVSREMLKGGVLLGGEEAGGIGIRGHIPDRDALLAALLLLEMAGSQESISQRLDQLFDEVGRLYYGRVDLPVDGNRARDFHTTFRDLPPVIAGLPVLSVDRNDGVRIGLGEEAWLLLRCSGTEPLVRVYAEAPEPELLDTILEQGTILAGKGAGPECPVHL